DLADAGDRVEAEELYAEQARSLRDALVAADTVLAVWREPLAELAEGNVGVDRSIDIRLRLPAHRLMPVALVAPERRITVTPVCGARTLAEGRPPLGIACAQQDIAHVYPLPDDPQRCLEDFLERAERARANARRLRRGGPVQIVAYDSATSHALASRTGLTRVVWKTPDTLTVVQCVRVRRSGSALRGLTVRLLALSAPIRRTAG